MARPKGSSNKAKIDSKIEKTDLVIKLFKPEYQKEILVKEFLNDNWYSELTKHFSKYVEIVNKTDTVNYKIKYENLKGKVLKLNKSLD